MPQRARGTSRVSSGRIGKSHAQASRGQVSGLLKMPATKRRRERCSLHAAGERQPFQNGVLQQAKKARNAASNAQKRELSDPRAAKRRLQRLPTRLFSYLRPKPPGALTGMGSREPRTGSWGPARKPPAGQSNAEGDSDLLGTAVAARPSGDPKGRRVSREGNGHRDPDGSKHAGLLRNSACFLWFCFCFFDWELLKTAANGFQNILHLFIAKRADHEVWGTRRSGKTTA